MARITKSNAKGDRVLTLRELNRPLLHVPPAGTWGFHGRPELLVLEAWLGVELPVRDEGAKQLVRSYLASFGPATQQDLLRFAGVRVGDLRPGLDQLELRTFRDER